MLLRHLRAHGLFAVLALISGACSASSLSSVEPSRATQTKAPSVEVTRWDYHPLATSRLRVRRILRDGTYLFAGEGGERWLSDPKTGTALAASARAPEDLVAIAHADESRFVFIGSGGTMFISRSPLGAFDEAKKGPGTFARVVAAGQLIVGALLDGTLVRSADAGLTFSRVPFAGEQPFEVALGANQRAMVLTSPEQIWLSNDDAVTFRQAALPSLGATSLAVDRHGRIAAEGLLSSAIWEGEGDAGLVVRERPVEHPPLDLFADLAPGPRGEALLAGRAVLDGQRYIEAVAPQKPGKPWSLAQGEVLGRTRSVALPSTNDCGQIVAGANGRFVALLCLTGASRRREMLFPPVRLLFSDDGGITFGAKALGLVADEEGARVHVLPTGVLVLTGACRPHTHGLCEPASPIRVEVHRRTAGYLAIASTLVPELPNVMGRVGSVAISPDGRRLYAGAILAPDRKLAVLVSDDESRTYRAVLLDASVLAYREGAKPRDLLETSQAGELRVDRQGNVSWLFTTSAGIAWVVLDADARARSITTAPRGYPYLVAVGRHAVVFSDQSGDLLQSGDGGKHYAKIATLRPTDLVQDDRAVVYCVADGCVFGDALSRVGWGDQAPGLPASDSVGDQPSIDSASVMRSPIECKPLGKASIMLNASNEISVHQTDRSDGVVWTSLAIDWWRGAVSVVHGLGGTNQRTQVQTLLRPVDGKNYSMLIMPQVEGTAALRFPIARGSDSKLIPGTDMKSVEVVWENLYEGGVRRATVKSWGRIHADDVATGAGQGTAPSRAGLLSISGEGIYVCAHAVCTKETGLPLYLDGKGGSHVVTSPPWPEHAVDGTRLTARDEYVRIHGKDVGVVVPRGKGVLMRSEWMEDEPRIAALGLIPETAEGAGFRTHTGWTYLRSMHAVGLSFTVMDASENHAFSRLLDLEQVGKTGATYPALATQRDLADPPVACTPAQRRSLVRVLSPPLKGTRHPVVVRGDGEAPEKWLITGEATVYGSPGAACASILDASDPTTEKESTQVLVTLDDLEHSWLFRSGTTKHGGLEWQRLACRFDRSLRVPQGIVETWNATLQKR